MSNQSCQRCGKGKMTGAKHRHHRGIASHKFEKRAQARKVILKPNLHWITIKVDGRLQRLLLCTKCIKRLKFIPKKVKPTEKPETTKS